MDQIYLKTNEKIESLFEADIKIVSGESNNQSDDYIMNMIVLTKDHQSFHAYSKSVGLSKLELVNEEAWNSRAGTERM